MVRAKWILLAGVTFLGLIVIFAYIVYLTVPSYHRPVTPTDIRELSKVLASLLDGKHSLVEVVRLAAQKVRHPSIKRSLLSIYKSLYSRSEPLYKFLEEFPDIYPPEFVMAVNYGSKLGKVDIVLKKLSENWPDQPEERRDVVKEILKPLALQTLKDERWFYRSYALYVLAMLRCKDTISEMLPLLQDPDPRVREAAHKTLQELGYKVK